MEWENIKECNLAQVTFKAPIEEPFELYRARYLESSSTLRVNDARRYVKEVLVGLKGSLLVVGSGHSDHCNVFSSECSDLKVTASDFVIEARTNLHSNISFVELDLLSKDLHINKFDYVFSSHTLEHFYKRQLFDIVWPNIVSLAKKAVITVVPYADSWEDEPSHKCKFFENDEFATLQDRYKIIFNGQEILFWKDII